MVSALGSGAFRIGVFKGFGLRLLRDSTCLPGKARETDEVVCCEWHFLASTNLLVEERVLGHSVRSCLSRFGLLPSFTLAVRVLQLPQLTF